MGAIAAIFGVLAALDGDLAGAVLFLVGAPGLMALTFLFTRWLEPRTIRQMQQLRWLQD